MSKKQYKVGFFDDPMDVDDYVEYDGQYLTCSDVVELLNKKDEQIESLVKKIEAQNKIMRLYTCFGEW